MPTFRKTQTRNDGCLMRMFELQSASAEHKRVLLKRVKVNLSHIVSIQSIVKQIGGGDSSQTETASYNMIRIQHQHTKYIACKSLSYLYHIQIFNCKILQLAYPPILHQLMTNPHPLHPPFTSGSPVLQGVLTHPKIDFGNCKKFTGKKLMHQIVELIDTSSISSGQIIVFHQPGFFNYNFGVRSCEVTKI